MSDAQAVLAQARRHAVRRDAEDELASCRDRFSLPSGVVYLDGNSLGPAPLDASARVAQCVTGQWGEGLIGSWNSAGWLDAPRRIGERIGRLIGARPGETVVCDSTSVNLYKLLAAAMRMQSDRGVILTESANFPTDRYIVHSVAELADGRTVRAVAREALADALDEEVAVLIASHVDFRSGHMLDLRRLTAQAHAAGALTVWDLAHSAGAVPLNLAEDGADFAAGCGYKYLNGGPGAPAFLYVAGALQARAASPIAGWFGHARPFAFEQAYAPADGIDRWLVGTPPIVALAALEAGVDTFDGLSVTALRRKSEALSAQFVELADALLSPHGFTLASPRDAAQRGSQISLCHAHAWEICQAWIDAGVIGDFRAPDLLRVGFTPLYLRHVDVVDAVERLLEILVTGRWREERFAQRLRVT